MDLTTCTARVKAFRYTFNLGLRRLNEEASRCEIFMIGYLNRQGGHSIYRWRQLSSFIFHSGSPFRATLLYLNTWKGYLTINTRIVTSRIFFFQLLTWKSKLKSVNSAGKSAFKFTKLPSLKVSSCKLSFTDDCIVGGNCAELCLR